jgi:hypothetical protein
MVMLTNIGLPARLFAVLAVALVLMAGAESAHAHGMAPVGPKAGIDMAQPGDAAVLEAPDCDTEDEGHCHNSGVVCHAVDMIVGVARDCPRIALSLSPAPERGFPKDRTTHPPLRPPRLS